MRHWVIIGTGGHCRAVIEIARSASWGEPQGIYELGELRRNERIMNIPVVGRAADLEFARLKETTRFMLAIGDNATRKDWYLKLSKWDCEAISLVSPFANIAKSAKLGHGVVVAPYVFVGPEASVGNNTILNTAAVVEHESVVGDHCHLAPGSIMCGRSQLGDTSFVCARATIVDEIAVARNSIIGAGGVVIRSIHEEGCTWVGVPAKRLVR